jgi:cell shape-determining protein MreC
MVQIMKRGPNDLDEIIDRLKKENKRLKKECNEKNKKKQKVRA